MRAIGEDSNLREVTFLVGNIFAYHLKELATEKEAACQAEGASTVKAPKPGPAAVVESWLEGLGLGKQGAVLGERKWSGIFGEDRSGPRTLGEGVWVLSSNKTIGGFISKEMISSGVHFKGGQKPARVLLGWSRQEMVGVHTRQKRREE